MAQPGPKELQRRALREGNAMQRVDTPSCLKITKAAIGAAQQETQLKTKTTTTKKKRTKRAVAAEKKAIKLLDNAQKRAKTKAAKPAAAAQAPTKASTGVRPGSKLEMVVKLLRQPGGTTTAEILKVTGWPSVSVPQQAAAAGIKLKKVKDGKVSRYSEAPAD